MGLTHDEFKDQCNGRLPFRDITCPGCGAGEDDLDWVGTDFYNDDPMNTEVAHLYLECESCERSFDAT